MAFTPLKGYSIQTGGTNTGTWGGGTTSPPNQDLNNGVMLVMDNNLAGISSISLSSSNYTLSATDIGNCCLRFTGTLTANISVGPGSSMLFNGFYYWENLTSGAFTVTIIPLAGASVVLPQNRRGILFVDSTNGARIVSIAGSSTADPIPSGSVMTFYQASPPSGWTQVVSLNDYALRIVSGTGGTTGGSVAFSTAFASQTPTGSVSAPTVSVPYNGWSDGGQNAGPRDTLVVCSGTQGQTFGGFGYATNANQTVTASTPSFTGNAINLAVQYANIILASRN